ncbi:MAG TPA: hypothetical protein VL486_11345 [Verrucomicrobiae bacterium]|nr:hypothetical protein [Verrucomicrobiae bacterium]
MRTHRQEPTSRFSGIRATTSALFTYPVRHRAGFTLTELVVLVVVGTVLSGVLVADLNQSRTTLLRQACAANLKQWGTAIYLYSEDYNGTFFYAFTSVNFDDIDSPYYRYLGGTDTDRTVRAATMRTARICPAVAARMTQEAIPLVNTHTYSMPVAMQSRAGGYITTMPQSDNGVWIFNLRSVPYPSQYLLMIDSKGNALTCGPGHLINAVTAINSSSGDSISALDRHGGAVNCLFGDLHVENVSTQSLNQVDSISCVHGNPWFMMN